MAVKRELAKHYWIGKGIAFLGIVFGVILLVIIGAHVFYKLYEIAFPEKKVSIVTACKRDLNNPNTVVPVDGSCRDVVLVSGLIEDEVVRQFRKLPEPDILTSQGIDTVCFVSRGGEPRSGHDLAKEIQRREMNTCIADLYLMGAGKDGVKPTVPGKTEIAADMLCASTCPFVFLAGKERILLGDKIRVKVHKFGKSRIYLGKEFGKKDIDKEEKEIDYFLKMSALVSKQHEVGVMKFYKKAMEKKFTDENLLVIPSDELVGMNVVTKWDKTL